MYYCFDIESVPDGYLLNATLYRDQDYTPDQAIEAKRAEILEASDNRSDWIAHPYHLPVSIAIAIAGDDFELKRVATIDRPNFDPETITQKFWQGVEKQRPCLVTFNGRGFDIPVMEHCAYRFGLSLPYWFSKPKYANKQPRNRYNQDAQLDLMEFLSNFGAARYVGGLNLAAHLAGGPGKLGTKGSMVLDLYRQGKHLEIDDYCVCDACDTYVVFIRTRLLAGLIDAARAREILTNALATLETQVDDFPILRTWIDASHLA